MMYALWEQKPQKYDCTLCYDGESKIRYISGMNMQSKEVVAKVYAVKRW